MRARAIVPAHRRQIFDQMDQRAGVVERRFHGRSVHDQAPCALLEIGTRNSLTEGALRYENKGLSGGLVVSAIAQVLNDNRAW